MTGPSTPTAYALFLFNPKCECIYYYPVPLSLGMAGQSWGGAGGGASSSSSLDWVETSKLVYGVIYSLRNIITKLSPILGKDNLVSYKTSHYKCHFYSTASNLRFVLLTTPDIPNAQAQLATLYRTYVECVVKNPLWRGVRREEATRAAEQAGMSKQERKRLIGLGIDIACPAWDREVGEWLRAFAPAAVGPTEAGLLQMAE